MQFENCLRPNPRNRRWKAFRVLLRASELAHGGDISASLGRPEELSFRRSCTFFADVAADLGPPRGPALCGPKPKSRGRGGRSQAERTQHSMLRSDSKVFLGGDASRTKPCRSFVGWADPGLPTRFSGGWNRRVLLEQPALTGRSRCDNRCRSSGLLLEPSPEGDPVAPRRLRRPSPKRGGRASPRPRPGGRPRRSEDRVGQAGFQGS